jgi:TusA-related sulfurtransferase
MAGGIRSVCMERDMKANKTLDIKGLAGQRPGEVTKEILSTMVKGQVLRVISDDAATKQALPLLCEYLGYQLLSIEEDRGVLCFTIMK